MCRSVRSGLDANGWRGLRAGSCSMGSNAASDEVAAGSARARAAPGMRRRRRRRDGRPRQPAVSRPPTPAPTATRLWFQTIAPPHLLRALPQRASRTLSVPSAVSPVATTGSSEPVLGDELCARRGRWSARRHGAASSTCADPARGAAGREPARATAEGAGRSQSEQDHGGASRPSDVSSTQS